MILRSSQAECKNLITPPFLKRDYNLVWVSSMYSNPSERYCTQKLSQDNKSSILSMCTNRVRINKDVQNTTNSDNTSFRE